VSELQSLGLGAALVGGLVVQKVERALPGWPSLPALPSLPEIPAFAPRQLWGRALGHVPSFWRRDGGLWVPAAPALIEASRVAAGSSYPDAGRSRPSPAGRPPLWADAIDTDGLVAFLRQRHPTKTAQHVAALTGEPAETVRKWLSFSTRPSLRALIVLVCVYELPLLEACLRRHPDWMKRAREDRGHHALAAEMAAFRDRLDSHLGTLHLGAAA
jgi:hypothetical protein